MDKNNLNKFLLRFKYLDHAGLLISGDFYKSDLTQNTIGEIEMLLNQSDIWAPRIYTEIFDEIEKNLFDQQQLNLEIYLKRTLKKFNKIAPFLNIAVDKEYCIVNGKQGFTIGNQKYSHNHFSVYNTLLQYRAWEMQNFYNFPITIPEKYVIQCFHAYRLFFNQLDIICQDFSIDLMKVQHKFELSIWEREEGEESNSLEITVGSGPNETQFSVKQIALIYVYNEQQITRENADEIAAKYGYISKSSGEGLFQDYSNYCSPANRKGKPTLCTPKKLKNKINLFESITEHLTVNAKKRAYDELQILKTIFETEYQ